jgi:hypothetical protein
MGERYMTCRQSWDRTPLPLRIPDLSVIHTRLNNNEKEGCA